MYLLTSSKNDSNKKKKKMAFRIEKSNVEMKNEDINIKIVVSNESDINWPCPIYLCG